MKKNILLLFVSLAVSLFLAEVALRSFTPFPISQGSNQQFHPELLYTLDPALLDVNSEGFRNPNPYRGQDIVAIGDSHTYGNNVLWDKSWPYQLGRMSGYSVYNAGVGSYTIYQYARLVERYLKEGPRHILVGLYPSNDMKLMACDVMSLPYWKQRSRRSDGLTNHCEETIEADDYEDEKDFLERILEPIKKLAIVNSLDVVLMDRYYHPFVDWLEGGGEDTGTQFHEIGGENGAVLIKKERIREKKEFTDWSDTGVQNHFRNFETLFSRLAVRAEKQGASLGVLIIPSKMRVYDRWARKNSIDVPENLRDYSRHEIELTGKVKEVLDRVGIPWRDATLPLVDLMEDKIPRGENVYKHANGHPLADGYRVYARTALPLVSASSSRSDTE